MSFTSQVDRALQQVSASGSGAQALLERFTAEVKFAGGLAKANPPQQATWEGLILQAVQAVQQALATGTPIAQAVSQGEAIMAPMSAAAKAYTIHCTGHAHIDMNWMWNWPETVATVNDTFTTVDKLMDEFPNFTFSQSQASVYRILKDYLPELYARVKARIAEGRWEITASQWVEGDKNMASGEIICRHLLYTRRFVEEEFGIPFDGVAIDWEPDTFGHPHSLPGLLAKGGVKYYYFHRGHDRAPWLFWWQGQDGSRVLAFDDFRRGYNGAFGPNLPDLLFDFEQQTGLKDFLFVYGVGDHGGGPTRRDLVMAHTMMEWPIFPTIKLSTLRDFFAAAEQAPNLSVLDDEMNFILEGCYTAQSNIKRANRASENALVEAECCALLGGALADLPYPTDDLYTGWRHAMFNQFHDILPGSGVHATYEYAQGLFQEITTLTSMVKTRALRAIAGKVHTAIDCDCQPADGMGAGIGAGVGAGQGDLILDGGMTRYGGGGTCCDTFVIFNPSPWMRSEVLTLPLWDRDWQPGQLQVRDDAGRSYPAQYLSRNHFWGHNALNVAIPVHDVPAMGYRTFSVMRSPEPGTAAGACGGNGRGIIENEFLTVEVDQESGAVIHLIDKATGLDLVPDGEYLGALEYVLEAPHSMSSWIYGQPVKTVQFLEGATLECPHNGPYYAAVKAQHKYNDSTFTVTIALAAGVPRVDFTLEMNWLERGHDGVGVPTLRAVFPLDIADPHARYETPNGWVERPADPTVMPSYTYRTLSHYSGGSLPHLPQFPVMVPAQKWADLTGTRSETRQPVGATLLNTTKYGHSADGGTLRLDLIRSSYDPDPLPEFGQHTIRYALQPHIGPWTPADAARAGYAYNFAFNAVGTGQHAGELPASAGFVDVRTPNVLLSGLKPTEDGAGLIVRLYEANGVETTAEVALDQRLLPAGAAAVETDVLERPLPQSTASLADGVLTITLPPFGTATVRIG